MGETLGAFLLLPRRLNDVPRDTNGLRHRVVVPIYIVSTYSFLALDYGEFC